MRFDWPYFHLDIEGRLRCEDGDDLMYAPDGSVPTFADALEAEEWLVENDIRGNVRSEPSLSERLEG